jgi:hypothetical protein
MSTIESSVIGTLVQEEKFEDWWTSKPQTVNLIEADLPITFMDYTPFDDEDFEKDADAALKLFFELDSFYKLKIAPHVFENFVEYCSYISEADIPEKMKGAQPLSIWSFIQPTQVFVSRRLTNDKDIYIVLACECEWEKEHGLQLVFRQGKQLTRVSDQDGHLTDSDAFDIPDHDDKLLAAF